jgi:hypothetical protein
MIFLSESKFLCVGNELQHWPLATLIKTKPFLAMQWVATSRERPLHHSSSSYLILLHIPRHGDPGRTFIAHEHTQIVSKDSRVEPFSSPPTAAPPSTTMVNGARSHLTTTSNKPVTSPS